MQPAFIVDAAETQLNKNVIFIDNLLCPHI